MRFNWTFDPQRQALHTPAGHTIPLHDVAVWLQDQVHHRHDLTGPWAGWKVRGRFLCGPHGVRLTPERLRALARENDD